MCKYVTIKRLNKSNMSDKTENKTEVEKTQTSGGLCVDTLKL